MFDQLAITILGGGAIYLTNDDRLSVRKWAPVLGLLSQPFWFYSAYQAEQWGIFAVSFWYTFAWARGFYNNWMKQT